MMSVDTLNTNVQATRIASRLYGMGRAAPPVWLGRALLLSTLFLVMSICHGAVAPETAMAAPARENLPVHALDCAVDVAAATPASATVKCIASAQPAADCAAISLTAQTLVWPSESVPIDSPSVRRARLQVFLI